MVKVGSFNYEKSTRKGKKLMVTVNDKLIHFGDSNMQHYKDKTKIWSHMDHLDDKRRENYLKRAYGIKNKQGKRTGDDPLSPNYHAIRVLW
jgi:hypothetical protein